MTVSENKKSGFPPDPDPTLALLYHQVQSLNFLNFLNFYIKFSIFSGNNYLNNSDWRENFYKLMY